MLVGVLSSQTVILYQSYDYVVGIEHEDRGFGKDTASKLRGILLAKQPIGLYVV